MRTVGLFRLERELIYFTRFREGISRVTTEKEKFIKHMKGNHSWNVFQSDNIWQWYPRTSISWEENYFFSLENSNLFSTTEFIQPRPKMQKLIIWLTTIELINLVSQSWVIRGKSVWHVSLEKFAFGYNQHTY